MEDFSLALLEDGQELGSSHGFWGKLISNEGFSLGNQDFRLRNPVLVVHAEGLYVHDLGHVTTL